MIKILIDHNIEGQALTLWKALQLEGWTELLEIEMLTFASVNLPDNSNDRFVWRFAQDNSMILLTDNRNMEGKDSLEQTIREENKSYSLPIITIGNKEKLFDKQYRQQCVERLLEIILYLHNYLGTGRQFIP